MHAHRSGVAWLLGIGASLLFVFAWTSAASAACDPSNGNRLGPPVTPGDLCDSVVGVQTVDSDGDGFGNACDADYLPAWCRVGIRDFRRFRANWGLTVPPGDPDTDHSDPADAIIGVPDYSVFSGEFGGAPD